MEVKSTKAAMVRLPGNFCLGHPAHSVEESMSLSTGKSWKIREMQTSNRNLKICNEQTWRNSIQMISNDIHWYTDKYGIFRYIEPFYAVQPLEGFHISWAFGEQPLQAGHIGHHVDAVNLFDFPWKRKHGIGWDRLAPWLVELPKSPFWRADS